jgi:hypothetical protein
MRRAEDEIQRAIFAHLASRGAKDVVAFAVPNGGYRRTTEAAIMKGLGVKAGIPDIIAIKGGQMFGLELKTTSGRVSEAQRETIAALRAAGAIVATAFGLDDALAQLEQWQLLRGHTSTGGRDGAGAEQPVNALQRNPRIRAEDSAK